MARYSHLPIYRLCYAHARDMQLLLSKLPKALKHPIGDRLLSKAMDCIDAIIQANNAEEKLSHMAQAGFMIESSWSPLRILYDTKGLSRGEFQTHSERMGEIAKQIAAWMKWEKGRLRQKAAANPETKK